MKIPLNEISTPGLLRLLRDVAAELEARHNAPTVQHVHATRPVETVRVPPEDDADFCLMIAARLPWAWSPHPSSNPLPPHCKE